MRPVTKILMLCAALLLYVSNTYAVTKHAPNLPIGDAAAPVSRERGNMAGKVKPQLAGVWRSRGYGWILKFNEGKARVYDVTEHLCLKQRRGSTELDDIGRTVAFSNRGNTIHLTVDDTNYAYTFDRIKTLPKHCLTEPDDTPTAVFNAVVEIFDTHYAFFSVRNVDWARLVREHRAKVHNDLSQKALFKIIKSLLSNIDDGHVTLRARIKGTKRTFDAGLPRASGNRADLVGADPAYWMRGIGEKLVIDDLETGAGKSLRFGLIENRIGVLSIREMSGGGRKSINNAMNRAMEIFKDAKAVIIDVSMNGGGEDTFARQIASRFASKRTVGYYKYAGDGEGERPQPIFIEPADATRYTGPVFLITSHKTASAAEIFTLALRALPNVTHIGDTTEGILSDMLEKRLPNGWRLSLSNEVYLDSRQALWEGRGIQPDVFADVRKRKKANAKHKMAARQFVKQIMSR